MSSDPRLTKITIDGVHVICENTEPNFSIGTYNMEYVPEIECINGGSIDCPEMTGTRVLVAKAEPPGGSTKISDNAEYAIVTGTDNIPYSAKQLSVLQKINEAGLSDSRLTRDILPEDMEAYLTYAQYGLDCSPMFKHYDKVKRNCSTYLGALYVGAEPDDEGIFKIISTMHHLGMIAEAQLDKVKQMYAYIYLFDYVGPISGMPDDPLTVLKPHFLCQHPDMSNISNEEMRFWWELIPVMEYKKMGTIEDDVAYYYYGHIK